MTTAKNRLQLSLLFLVGFAATGKASTVALPPGTFANDADYRVFTVTSTGTQNYVFSTSSFAAGGFVPVLTLYNSSGMDLGSDGGDGPCVTAATCKDDALLSQTLAAGTYSLYLTEFPNTPSPVGTLASGFLFGLGSAGDSTLTGDFCGVSGGMFLQTDTASCSQRTNQYAVSYTNTAVLSSTPEPGTLFLVLPAGLIILGFSRRSIA